jgi:hypothetical protein
VIGGDVPVRAWARTGTFRISGRTVVGVTGWVSHECALPTAEQPLRVAEFDAVFATAVGPPRRPAPGRLEVVLAVDAEPVVRDLVARETACCSFFAFTVLPGTDGTALAVEVPAAHVEVLDALQGRIETARAG